MELKDKVIRRGNKYYAKGPTGMLPGGHSTKERAFGAAKAAEKEHNAERMKIRYDKRKREEQEEEKN